jgi:hypothetical protein
LVSPYLHMFGVTVLAHVWCHCNCTYLVSLYLHVFGVTVLARVWSYCTCTCLESLYLHMFGVTVLAHVWCYCTCTCLVSPCYFTFLCLTDLIFAHYVLWYIAKDFLSLQEMKESKNLVTHAKRISLLRRA